jgi:hypothetical protein
MSAYLLRCTTLSLAQSGHCHRAEQCLLSGVKRTLAGRLEVSAALGAHCKIRLLALAALWARIVWPRSAMV